MTHRKILRLAAVALAALWLNLASAAGMGVDDARHLLNRVGFGATPEAIVEYSKLSREQAIERVLTPTGASPKVPPPSEIARHVPGSELRVMRDEDTKNREKNTQNMILDRNHLLKAWWVDEMMAANTPAEQLRERMVLFWHNHFVSSYAKIKQTRAMLDQNQVFRANALGEYDDMLHKVSKGAAMIEYLDSQTNRKDSPNENFAREVMELFTLGEGNYTEKDIKEAARAFTGWTIDRETGEAQLNPRFHDAGEKTIMGKTGNFGIDETLDILLAQPKAAEFIVTKLWREFVSYKPDSKEVQRIAADFRKSGYNVRTAVGGLLRSPAFWAKENRAVMIKSPVDLVVGTLHTFYVKADGLPFSHAISSLGQNLFGPPNVKGWPGGEAWINSQTLLARKQFIERLFRSEDAPNEGMDDTEGMDAMDGKKGKRNKKNDSTQADSSIRAQAVSKLDGMHASTREWMKKVAALGLKPEQVLLAVPTTKSVTTHAELRAVLLDTTYQVK